MMRVCETPYAPYAFARFVHHAALRGRGEARGKEGERGRERERERETEGRVAEVKSFKRRV